MAAADADASSGSDKDHEACAAYKQAKKQEIGRREEDGPPKKRGKKRKEMARRRMGLIAALNSEIGVATAIVSITLRQNVRGAMRPEVKLARRLRGTVRPIGHPISPSARTHQLRRRIRYGQ